MFDKTFVRRLAVGTTLAAGVGVAAMVGAGTASALPGISYDRGPGDPIGIGDNSPSGAQANASDGNRALAISIFRPARAEAVGQNRTGNRVLAVDGSAGFLKDYIDPYTNDHDNTVIAINGTAMVHGGWNNVMAIGGKVSNRVLVTYPDGSQQFVPSHGVPLRPNTVVAVCGQRLAEKQDVFETSGNCLP
ncbi:hypothetical protein CQY20_03285 [Mycolicibacterium agri]|uniref:Uncharacterized protein n=1 Tax=Mycolicibacterium agri TaxID=36811 RepID=A0A2A7NEZ1_MYCAG|nr:hypothetical protein [Mycolicibacterium agri]PEG42430.1 hypothetical protein CQY20_03285 [Mycolicibacterium agri]GFG51304.1 hypothetical protein MAGR_27450 [Mycolicibacterium agri]